MVLGGALRAPTCPWSACSPRTPSRRCAPTGPSSGPAVSAPDGQVLDTTGVEVPVKRAHASPPRTRSCCWPTGTSSPGPGRSGSAAIRGHQRARHQRRSRPAHARGVRRGRRGGAALVKLAILGGGGFRVPLVYGALLRDTSEQRVDRVSLYDVDERPPRRRRARAGPDGRRRPGRARRSRRPPTSTTALRGRRLRLLGDPRRRPGRAHARRAGGARPGRARPGDDRPGRPGVRAAHRAGRASRSPSGSRALAPDAWVINFTNPAGMVTEAMQRRARRPRRRHLRLADRAGPPCRPRRSGATRTARRSTTWGSTTSAGCAGCRTTARDVLPDLLADDTAALRHRGGPLFGADWIRSAGRGPQRVPLLLLLHPRRGGLDPRQPRRPGASSCSTSSAASTTRSPPTRSQALGEWHRVRRERDASYMAESARRRGRGARRRRRRGRRLRGGGPRHHGGHRPRRARRA